MIEDFYDLLLVAINRRANEQSDAILAGGALTFDSYREGVGFLRGLEACQSMMKDCLERYERFGDDEGEEA